jgi:spore germination cell wall hydrolase CwlJ-like protein
LTDSPTKTPSLALQLILGVIALVLVAVPIALVTLMPPVKPTPKGIRFIPQRVVPKTELPPVEPVEFQKVDPNDAVAFNDSIPIVTGPNPAARPFIFTGSSADLARAIDCLAIGQLYEAGDDVDGERAVAQVILNRVRHPAFPKSVCGVIFQGAERSTGCQFSFACDGAMMRWRPSGPAFARARGVATAALAGSVYAPVGYATHYHTNWVVPYWSSSLDKIAQVKTHLFFRWTGWWGTPAAFARTVSGFEPNIAMLGGVSPAHVGPGPGVAMATINPAEVDSAPSAGKTGTQPLSIDPNSFLVTLDPRAGADSFQAVAARACGARDYCKLMAWTDKSRTPASLPLGQAQIATMSFSYLRDKARGYEKALWNCAQFKRASKGECMKLQVLGIPPTPPSVPETKTNTAGTAKPVTPGAPPPAVTFTLKPVTPDGLGGVRRKPGDAASKPAPTPAPRPTLSLSERP